MDAQYPFASRDDIWRVFEELKELHATQFEQAERIARLERRRDEDARLKSVWGPLSPFPTSVAGTIPTAVCSGSYKSSLGYPMIQKLGLEDLVTQEEGLQFIKLPMYLPEASIHQSSSRPGSPAPQLPALTVRFLVRDIDLNDPSIQIVLGSDILRSHNAELLFSQDKIIMVDDERNKISIPLVRPEDDSAFKFLRTASDASRTTGTTQSIQASPQPDTNGHSVGVIGPPRSLSRQSRSASASARDSTEEPEESRKTSLDTQELPRNAEPTSVSKPAVVAESPPDGSTKVEPAGVWGSWKRDTILDSNASTAGKTSRTRPMKVLRPTKSSSRTSSATAVPTRSSHDAIPVPSQPASSRASPDETRTGKPWVSNPIGGASAFGWLNSSQPTRAVTNPK
ncbi:hypothetical protein APSETT444_009282 [Aspergillus pseudonomiae]